MNNSWVFRAWHLLVGWGGVGVIYTLTDHLQGPGRLITPSLIDRLIAFNPHAIWLYLSFFIVIPMGYALAPIERVRWLSLAMRLTALGAGTVYLVWPTTLVYPLDTGTTLSSTALAALTWVDSAQNCLPSLHMALMVLAVWAIHAARRPLITCGAVLWVAAIAFSILQLRRHLLIDVLSGALLALLAGRLAERLQRARTVELKAAGND
jgi:membrane-associated phospholipid phosphatase